MKTKTTFLLRFLPLLGLCVFTARAAEDVASPAKRTEAIDQAKALLMTKDKAPAVKDPFHSIAYDEALGANTARGSASAGCGGIHRGAGPVRIAICCRLSPPCNLKTSGFFVLGGEPTLVFGQKRVKAGGVITIHFEGADYTLEVVSIERPNFTLRLNHDEFTRPIK